MPRRLDARARASGLLATGCLALLGCGQKPPGSAPQGAPGQAREVETAEAARAGREGTLALPGVVSARQRAALAARLAAAVVELPLEEGQSLAAGTIVARLDDSALRAAVAAADASLAAAEADLARMRALLERGAATRREREDAAAREAGARAALALARDNLAYAVLRAPFRGRIAARPVNVGDVVAPGQTLVEVEGESGYELRASVDAERLAVAKPGDKLTALVDGQDGPLTATLRSVSPAGDPATHRFEVKADLPAAPGLRSGLFARLAWPTPGGHSGPLVVPDQAVFERGGLSGVFVVSEGRARLRWVAVGRSSGGSTEIRAGLEAGERVATQPAGLAEGAAVREIR